MKTKFDKLDQSSSSSEEESDTEDFDTRYAKKAEDSLPPLSGSLSFKQEVVSDVVSMDTTVTKNGSVSVNIEATNGNFKHESMSPYGDTTKEQSMQHGLYLILFCFVLL